jgi:sugar-phosphatase
MDGVIVDSEPYWRKVMIKGFSDAGLPFTEADCRKTTGMRFDQVVHYWFKKKGFNKEPKQLEKEIIDDLCTHLRREAKPMKGLLSSLNLFRKHNYKIGLATSSSTKIIKTVLDKLQIEGYFDAIQSADKLKFGKPHPEVYLKCAAKLKADPALCLVIEDSMNGLIAGKSAGMKTIAVPDKDNFNKHTFCIADIKLRSLSELKKTHLNKLSNQ